MSISIDQNLIQTLQQPLQETSEQAVEQAVTLPVEEELAPFTPPLKGKGWTLGDSNGLVQGRAAEPAWVSLAWLLGPVLLGVAVIYYMLHM